MTRVLSLSLVTRPVHRYHQLGAARQSDGAGRHGQRRGRSRAAGGIGRRRQRRHEGYLRDDDQRARATTTSSSSGPADTRSRVTLPNFQTFRATGVEVATNQVIRTNADDAGRRPHRDQSTSQARRRCSTPTARRSSETIGERAIVELPLSGRNVWSLASTTPGVLGGIEQRHRPELPRRRPARNPEQPVARRDQHLLQPAGGDEHAADRRRGHRGPGADRQHVGRVRRLSRRAHQRGHQERHATRRTARCSTSCRTMRSTRAGYFENRAIPAESAQPRSSSASQFDGPVVIPKFYDGRNKTFFMGAYEGVRGEAITSPLRRCRQR